MLVLHKSSRPAARMPRADYLAMDFKIKALFVYCLAWRKKTKEELFLAVEIKGGGTNTNIKNVTSLAAFKTIGDHNLTTLF